MQLVQKQLEQLGIYSQWDLLTLAERANPPENMEEWGDIPFVVGDWTIIFFYDCGELDYIDSFIHIPTGTIINFWDWDENHKWRNNLICWRSVGDLQRLLEASNK